MKLSVFLCLACALAAFSPLHAQYGTDPFNPTGIYRPTPIAPMSSPTSTTIVVQKYIHDGALIYEYTPAGVRRHFDDLSLRADPLVVAQLQPLVDRMAAKTKKANSTAIGIGIGGGILCLGFLAGGLIVESQEDPASSPIDWYIFSSLTGIGTVFGVIFTQGLAPKESDLLEYVNRHNILFPEHPIEVY